MIISDVPMPRAEAFAAINSERAYQDDKFSGKSHSAIDRTLDEFILYIKQYADEAGALTTHENPAEALHFVRKVAALCVGCMETHGAPLRVGFERAAQNDKIQATIRPELQTLLLAVYANLPLSGDDGELYARAQTLQAGGLVSSVSKNMATGKLDIRLTTQGEALAVQLTNTGNG